MPKLVQASAAVVASVPPLAIGRAGLSIVSPLTISLLSVKPSVAVPKNAKQLASFDISNTGTDFEMYVES